MDRYDLPVEETPHQPDVIVNDFNQLADYLLQGVMPTDASELMRKEE